MTFILRPNLMFDSRAHYSRAELWQKRKDYIDKRLERLPGMRLTAGSIRSQESTHTHAVDPPSSHLQSSFCRSAGAGQSGHTCILYNVYTYLLKESLIFICIDIHSMVNWSTLAIDSARFFGCGHQSTCTANDIIRGRV